MQEELRTLLERRDEQQRRNAHLVRVHKEIMRGNKLGYEAVMKMIDEATDHLIDEATDHWTMSFRIRSLDRSFCLARCSEAGICYSTEDGPLCYCYDGTFGGSCSPQDAGVSNAPSGEEGGFELYHLVAAWMLFGLLVVICQVIWFCYFRRRTVVPRVVEVDVELSDDSDSWSVLDESDDWDEFDESDLFDGDFCLPASWVVVEDVEMEDVTL
ncbi:unnamed protein product [Nippostrongylus brasiliensis]|uniref:EGF-like domain-containing protein n=1 Tax=Nippostrongylus brasiliensis TaxID=27835 RepID=A0A0N4YN23_NIPBR|nr:unnamed protein product [Nippostrongylus brasiliensis]